MSKGKELLVHALDRLKHINFEDDHLTNDLIQTIQKYLAQPEPDLVYDLKSWENGYAAGRSAENERLLAQPEQEPVAWCQMVEGKAQDLLTSFEMKDWLYDKSWMPLYTTPPKRDPLSDKDIGKGFLLTDVWHRYECFIAGIKWAERQHGIGGGE